MDTPREWTAGAEAMRGAVMHMMVGLPLDASLSMQAREQLRDVADEIARLPVSRPAAHPPR